MMKDSKTRTHNRKTICGRLFATVMAMLLVFTTVPVVSVQAATKNPKLSVGTKKTMYVGDTATLKVKNKPASSKITWTSSNKKIVTVTKTGKLRAVKKGTATVTCKVTAKSLKKPYTLKCKVTVKNTAQTISTQSALQSALKNKKIDKITIKTDAAKTFTIPKGEYVQTKLVVDAPNADIVNYGVFKDIQIKNIKKDTFFEKAQGNTFNILAEAARLVMDSGANVKSVSVSKKDANVRIEVAKTAELGSVSVLAEAKVEIVTEGTVGKIDVTKVSSVSLSGTTKGIEIVVTKDAEGTEIDTAVPVKIETVAEIKISLGKGAEGSTIFTGSVSVSVIIKNNTDEKVTVTNPDGKKEDVESGKEQTVNPNGENEDVESGKEQTVNPSNPTSTSPNIPSGSGGNVTPTTSSAITIDKNLSDREALDIIVKEQQTCGADMSGATYVWDEDDRLTYICWNDCGLKGNISLKNFSALTSFHCYGNELTGLDLENNINLENLVCSKNPLISLDVSKNINLEYLECSDNNLTSLDVSNNTKLQVLHCFKNKLTSLNVGNNVELETLNCQDNNLTSLNIRGDTALKVLVCENNHLTSIDLSENTALTVLTCTNNELTSLVLANNTNLRNMECDNNQLTSLDVSENISLQTLQCGNNWLTNLDVRNNTNLWYLDCEKNQLSNLDIGARIGYLNCSENQLTSLNVGHLQHCTYLNCSNNQLTNLDVSNNTELRYLLCANNQLISLDVSNNLGIIELDYRNNLLTDNVDISNCSALKILNGQTL